MKIYITVYDYSQEAIKHLDRCGFEVVVRSKEAGIAEKSELKLILNNYDAVIIGIKDKISLDLISPNSKLKMIGTLSVGIDHIDPQILNSKQIYVQNLAGYNAISVSEFIFGQIICLYKGIKASYHSNGKRPEATTYDLFGKKLGVIGAGNIGSRVIQIAKAFGLDVSCHTKNPKNHTNLKVPFESLEEIFKSSDILVHAVPLTDQTIGMVNKDIIDSMSQTSIFVSISREQTYDIDYLIQKALDHSIFGLALDLDMNPNLAKISNENPNILLTPHLAGVSEDANNRADMLMAEKICESIL